MQYKQIPNKKSYGDEGHFIFLPNTKKKSCGLHPSKRNSKLFQRHLINFRMGVKASFSRPGLGLNKFKKTVFAISKKGYDNYKMGLIKI